MRSVVFIEQSMKMFAAQNRKKLFKKSKKKSKDIKSTGKKTLKLQNGEGFICREDFFFFLSFDFLRIYKLSSIFWQLLVKHFVVKIKIPQCYF